MRVRGRRTWLLRAAVGVLVLLVLVLAYQATRTALALRQVKADAAVLSEQVRRDDADGARTTLRHLTEQASVAHGHSDNVLWKAAGVLPWIGGDIDAVRISAGALDSAAGSALPEALKLYETLDQQELRTSGGRLNLAAIGRLEPRFVALAGDLAPADQQLSELDADDLKLGPVRTATRDLQDRMQSLVTLARAGATASRLLPPMMGGQQPRTYLLVVQNTAETRGTGGLPGSFLVLRARDGKLSLGRTLSASNFVQARSPVLKQSAEENTLYGPGPVLNIRETNEGPSFPRAARLIDAFYTQQFGGRLDGVLATDPVALAALLKATGPVKAGGDVFTAENAARKLLNTTYLRFDDPEAQDAFFAAAARGIFDKLTGRPVNQVEVVKALASVTSERRFMVWSKRPAERKELTGTPVAGDLDRGRSAGSGVGMYLNDATASKMGYYLEHVGGLRPTSCSDAGRQLFDARLRLKLNAPRDPSGLPFYITGNGASAPKGSLRLFLRIYGPPGGRITDVVANGKPIEASRFTHEGRPVAFVGMLLKPQGTITITARIETAEGQRGRPTLEWTPGMRKGATSISADSTCD